MAQAPKWAMDIALRVHGPIDIRWRRFSRHGSSGTYYTGSKSITVRAGTNRQDQKLVLLHELAHALSHGHHHDDTFWEWAWDLYRIFGLTTYALKREAGYKANATTVAAKMGIRGAKAAKVAAAARRAKNNDPRGKCDMPDDIAIERGYRPGHTHYIGMGHTEFWADGRRAYYSAKAR